jgi:predicted DNA-binding antitoxin AbrB/MazE fold protein
MTDEIECVYDGDVIRPLRKPELRVGEHMTITIRRRLRVPPIRLPDIITDEDVEEIREERWAST